MKRVKGPERVDAQQAGGQPLDHGNVDDHVAGPDEMIQAPLGDARAGLFQNLLPNQPPKGRHHLDGRECPQNYAGVLDKPGLRSTGRLLMHKKRDDR